MKPVVKYFLWAEIMDITTTNIGLMTGCVEANPLARNYPLMIIVKVIITFIVGAILQIKRPSKIDAVVPIAAGFIIPWNILNILLVWYNISI